MPVPPNLEVWKPSVTVAAVIERAGQFLVVEEETPDGLRINQPAGHLEFGESLQQAVIREALEETAHDFEPAALLGLYLLPTGGSAAQTTYLRVAFTGRLGAAHPHRALDAGIVRTLWLTRDQIAERRNDLRTPLVLRCVDDYLAGNRASLDLLHWGPGDPGWSISALTSGAGTAAR
jgi:8-oxo-dGTP pyrophosphatase MutT (NUDIX family)